MTFKYFDHIYYNKSDHNETAGKLSKFKVSSNNTSAHVYGTKFNFKDYPEDDFSEVLLAEGSLGVGKLSDDNILIIKPGEKAKMVFSSGKIERSRVNTLLYTSWIDGRVAFRNESLPRMIQKLERIYNVVIINNNKDLKEKYFTATILYKEGIQMFQICCWPIESTSHN